VSPSFFKILLHYIAAQQRSEEGDGRRCHRFLRFFILLCCTFLFVLLFLSFPCSIAKKATTLY
jgi:hypothetical protein